MKIVRDTGLPPETVLDQFDSRRFAALRRSWEKVPPLFEVVAAFAGVKPAAKPRYITTADDAKMLMVATGGRIAGVGRPM